MNTYTINVFLPAAIRGAIQLREYPAYKATIVSKGLIHADWNNQGEICALSLSNKSVNEGWTIWSVECLRDSVRVTFLNEKEGEENP
jgi:hypothetical protein